MDPLFPDDLGLEPPPAEASAAVVICCPNCGSKDPTVEMVDQASVATCPICQCQFECPAGQPAEARPVQGAAHTQPVGVAGMPMESSVQRILGRIFERHCRRQQHTHALKRVTGRPLSVQQYQPKLPNQ